MPRGVIAAFAALLAFAGCGSMSRAELKRSVESVNAVAAEGRVLADGVASDSTRATFTRVQARVLADSASHEAEKLADATPDQAVEDERDAGVALAQRVADALGELETFPGDESRAREVRSRLAAATDDGDELSHALEDAP
jgi:hypothetical protein